MDAERKQQILEAALRRAAQDHAHKLSNDQQYWDLVNFARDHVGRASHDALLRFKWAEYGYSEGCAAISFILCSLLAVVNRNLSISPDDFAEMAKERLISIREQYKDEDDYED
jgi:hypothetical protein